MRKKILCALAAVLASTLFFAGAASAGTLDLSDVKVEEKGKGGINEENLRRTDPEKGIFDNGSMDLVTIDSDGLFHVQTHGLSTSFYPGFGWFCFTQDLEAQLEDYLLIYNDPVGAIKDMIERDVHYSLVNSDFTTCIEIAIYEDALGGIVGTLSDLSPSDKAAVSLLLSTSAFPGFEVSEEVLGNETYYCVKAPDGHVVVFETYVKGVCVDVCVYSLSGTVTDTDLEEARMMLGDFVIE